jgi:hypothetical protein
MRTNPTAIQRLRAASTAVQSGQRPSYGASYGARPSLIFLRADGWKSGEKHRLKNRFNFGLSNGECRQSIEKLGGRSRARTYDPLIKRQVDPLKYIGNFSNQAGLAALEIKRLQSKFKLRNPGATAAGLSLAKVLQGLVRNLRGFESGVRYIAIPPSQEPYFLIGGILTREVSSW